MARQSRDALSVVVGNLGLRPDPPTELTNSEAAIWRATVASESSDYFRTDALRELLKDYCRHKASAAGLSQQISLYDLDTAMTPDLVKQAKNLLAMRREETAAAADKATKLRLTNQSRYTPQAAATAAKNASVQRKPWERD